MAATVGAVVGGPAARAARPRGLLPARLRSAQQCRRSARSGDARLAGGHEQPAPCPARGATVTGRLTGRRLLVVGGGTRRTDDPDAPMGNGRAIAVLAAAEGAAVAVTDRDEEAAQETVRLVADNGGTAHSLAADAGDPEACAAAVTWAVDVLGGLDGLVLNVGIGMGAGLGGTSVDDWDTVFDVNVRSHFLTLKAALPVMAEGSS